MTQSLNEILFDVYGERPKATTKRARRRKPLDPRGNWFEVTIEGITLLVDHPTTEYRHQIPAGEALAYALHFWDELPIDTKIDLGLKFGYALEKARDAASFVWLQVEEAAVRA